MAGGADGKATDSARSGYAFGVAAYILWGVLPLYFKAVAAVPSIDIVAYRVIGSIPVLALLLLVARSGGEWLQAWRSPRTVALLAVTAVLIAVNWLVYVIAINAGHLLAGSLGYYLNPLANILLGRFLLSEQLTRRQWIAVGVAAAGVAVLAAGALDTLWISLVLCFSFATYGLLRKVVAVSALPGLAIETMLLFPLALGWLATGGVAGRPMFGYDPGLDGLLAVAGLVSTIPLLLFTAASRRLPYSTVGMLQFLAPTLQFLLAVFLFGEDLTTPHLIAFAAIWIALGLYVSSLVSRRRRAGIELGEG